MQGSAVCMSRKKCLLVGDRSQVVRGNTYKNTGSGASRSGRHRYCIKYSNCTVEEDDSNTLVPGKCYCILLLDSGERLRV